MEPQKTIKILVDHSEEVRMKGALPLPGAGPMSAKVIELGTDAFRDNLHSTLSSFLEILSSIPMDAQTVRIEEMSFSLAFSVTGEVSLVSVVKGGLQGHTGIEFKIVRSAQ